MSRAMDLMRLINESETTHFDNADISFANLDESNVFTLIVTTKRKLIHKVIIEKMNQPADGKKKIWIFFSNYSW
jgi:hypothetical protein